MKQDLEKEAGFFSPLELPWDLVAASSHPSEQFYWDTE